MIGLTTALSTVKSGLSAVFGFIKAHPWKAAIGAVILGLVVSNFYLQHQVEEARAETRDVALELLNEQATQDSLQVVYEGRLEGWQQAATVMGQKVVQTEQRNGELAEHLDMERRARADLSVQVDSLQTVVQGDGVTEDSAGVRRAQFRDYREPYSFQADVALPRPQDPDPPTLDLSIQLDPIPLDIVLGCREEPNLPLRSATVGLAGPTWATVRADSVSQAPEVCNPVLENQGGGLGLGGTALSVGSGAVTGFLLEGDLDGALKGGGVGLSFDLLRRTIF